MAEAASQAEGSSTAVAQAALDAVYGIFADCAEKELEVATGVQVAGPGQRSMQPVRLRKLAIPPLKQAQPLGLARLYRLLLERATCCLEDCRRRSGQVDSRPLALALR